MGVNPSGSFCAALRTVSLWINQRINRTSPRLRAAVPALLGLRNMPSILIALQRAMRVEAPPDHLARRAA
jgi:hypothetical protein